jgi:hypothetical protein
MYRRDFIHQSAFAALLSALGELKPQMANASGLGAPAASGDTKFQMGKLNNPNAIAPIYVRGARRIGASPSPYVYAFYDANAKKFLNPLASETAGVKPVLAKGNYSVTPTLQSFNVQTATQAQFKNLQNQIQLGFNATAPNNGSDQLTWVFMSAIDIFLAKGDQGRQDALTKFTSNNKAGTTLSSNPTIKVTNGLLNLQVTAFGQRQDSIWTKFFDVISKVTSSPIVSTASKGFGVPGLVTEAVNFVDGVLDTIAQQDKLVPLWQTGGLQFAVTKDASADFNMAEGYWAVVDSDYAQHTNFLEGHTVDLAFQSFRIWDSNKKPVDTNYLLTKIQFTKA